MEFIGKRLDATAAVVAQRTALLRGPAPGARRFGLVLNRDMLSGLAKGGIITLSADHVYRDDTVRTSFAICSRRALFRELRDYHPELPAAQHLTAARMLVSQAWAAAGALCGFWLDVPFRSREQLYDGLAAPAEIIGSDGAGNLLEQEWGWLRRSTLLVMLADTPEELSDVLRRVHLELVRPPVETCAGK